MEEDDQDKTNQTKMFHPRVKTMHGNKSFNTVCASMKQHVKDARKKLSQRKAKTYSENRKIYRKMAL